MFKRLTYFIITIFVCQTGCRLNYVYLEKGNCNCKSLQAEFIASKLTCSRELLVPSAVLKSISREAHENLAFAKYGEVFNYTDVPAYPNKRVILSGITEDAGMGFVFFEHGGIAIQKYLLLYRKTRKKVYFTHYLLDKKYETLDSLKNAMVGKDCF